MGVVLSVLAEELRAVGVVVLRRGFRRERRLHPLGLGQLQGAVHLVGGYVVEALAGVALRPLLPAHLGGLQQRERAHDVGAGEGERVHDAAVHVALGRQVYHALHAVLAHQGEHGAVVADVGPDEPVVGPVLDVLEVGQVAGVGQLVNVYDQAVGILVDEQAHHVAANESGPAGDDDALHCLCFWFLVCFSSCCYNAARGGFIVRRGGAAPASGQRHHLAVGEAAALHGEPHQRALPLPALQSGGSGVYVEQAQRAVVLYLQYVRVSADEQLRRHGVDLSAHGRVVVAGIAAYVLDEHLGVLAPEAQRLAEHPPEVAAVAVATDGAQRSEGRQALCHLERAYVAGVPYLVARLEVLQVAVVPPAVRVADYAYLLHVSLQVSESEPAPHEVGNVVGRALKPQPRGVHAQVVRRAVAPGLARVVVVVGGAAALAALYYLARGGLVAALARGHLGGAVVEVGGYEHVNLVGAVAQYVVGAAAHEHARRLVGGAAYGVALKLEQALLRELVAVEVGAAHERHVQVEQRLEEPLLLVVLLEELLAEAALPGGQVEQLAVVVLAAEAVGQHPRYGAPAAAELPPHVYYYLLVAHIPVVVMVCLLNFRI